MSNYPTCDDLRQNFILDGYIWIILMLKFNSMEKAFCKCWKISSWSIFNRLIEFLTKVHYKTTETLSLLSEKSIIIWLVHHVGEQYFFNSFWRYYFFDIITFTWQSHFGVIKVSIFWTVLGDAKVNASFLCSRTLWV